MRFKLLALAVAATLLLTVVSAFAHYLFAAEYDAKKAITLTGTVTKVEWMNPHIFFYVHVKDSDGKVTNWRGEGGNLSGLMRRGWRKDSLKIGDIVTFEGSLAKNGQPLVSARTVTLADGKKLFAGSSGRIRSSGKIEVHRMTNRKKTSSLGVIIAILLLSSLTYGQGRGQEKAPDYVQTFTPWDKLPDWSGAWQMMGGTVLTARRKPARVERLTLGCGKTLHTTPTGNRFIRRIWTDATRTCFPM